MPATGDEGSPVVIFKKFLKHGPPRMRKTGPLFVLWVKSILDEDEEIQRRDDKNVALEDGRVVKALSSGSLRISMYVLNTLVPCFLYKLKLPGH